MTPKYLTKHNKFRIAQLFLETANRDVLYDDGSKRDTPIFTLAPDDKVDSLGNKYISMHKLFLKAKDVTGYDFAIKVLGSYEHFARLSAHATVGVYIAQWIEEVKAQLDSEAIKEIKRISKEGGNQTELSAAKYLANRDYEAKGSVGKPSPKNSRRKTLTASRQMEADTKAELKRLGLPH